MDEFFVILPERRRVSLFSVSEEIVKFQENPVKDREVFDNKTGDVIWQCSGQTRNVVPCPVVGFGKVFCMSGFRGSMLQAIERSPDSSRGRREGELPRSR